MTAYEVNQLRCIALDAVTGSASQREVLLARGFLETTVDSQTALLVCRLTDRAQELAVKSSCSLREALESLMVASGYAPVPSYSVLDATRATERKTMTLTGNQVWRQRGWIGQTGRIYGLQENPSRTERGSFAPLWELIHDEPVVPNGEEV